MNLVEENMPFRCETRIRDFHQERACERESSSKSTLEKTPKCENNEEQTVKLVVLEGEYIFDRKMHSPLLVERKDPRWSLLGQGLALVSARRAQQEFARYEITPVKTVIEAVKIAIVSMFFPVECSYVVQELKNRRKLRKFMDIHEVPSAGSVYGTLSRSDDSQFISLVTAILNSNCKWRRRHGLHTFLVDATAITLDLNWFKKTSGYQG